jgi:hypothetical protein
MTDEKSDEMTPEQHREHEELIDRLARSGQFACPLCTMAHLIDTVSEVHNLLCDIRYEHDVEKVALLLSRVGWIGDVMTACFISSDHYGDDNKVH